MDAYEQALSEQQDEAAAETEEESQGMAPSL